MSSSSFFSPLFSLISLCFSCLSRTYNFIFFCQGYLHCLFFFLLYQFIELLLIILFKSAFLTHFSRPPGHVSKNVKLIISGFLRLFFFRLGFRKPENTETPRIARLIRLIMVYVVFRYYIVSCRFSRLHTYLGGFREVVFFWFKI